MRLSRLFPIVLVVGMSCGSGNVPVPVHITGTGCGGDVVGSGFVIEDGLVITNAHVVAGAEDLFVELPGGAALAAAIVRFDPVRDLALLEADVAGSVAFGEAEAGDTGTILASDRSGETTPIEYEVRRLIVATGADIYQRGDHERHALELSADIDPGDSGAGVFDEQGALVGVAFASSRSFESTTYAVASSEVRVFVEGPSDRGNPSECP